MSEEIELEELADKVDTQLARTSKFLHVLNELHSKIEMSWCRAKINDFENAEEQCPIMVKLWEEFHKFSDGLGASGYRTHSLMSLVADALEINEGSKCEPWNPDC